MQFSPRLQHRFAEAACFILVLLFMYTGCSKLLTRQTFANQLAHSIPSPTITGLLSWMIPLTEIITAILLAITATRLRALYAALYLLVIFTAYISFLLLTDKNLPCSCGGIIAALNWEQHLVLNLLLLTLSITAIRIQGNRILTPQQLQS